MLQDPVTGEQLGRPPPGQRTVFVDHLGRSRKAPQTVAGFDLTFSAPKSVSVAWALADEPTRARIHAAHRRALEAVIAYGESQVFATRTGKGGVVSGGRARRGRDRVRPLGLPRRRPAAAHPRRGPQPGPGRHRRRRGAPSTPRPCSGPRSGMSELYNGRPRRRADRRPRLGLDAGAAAPLGRAEVGGRRRPAGSCGSEFSQRSSAIETAKDDLVDAFAASHGGSPPPARSSSCGSRPPSPPARTSTSGRCGADQRVEGPRPPVRRRRP